MDGVSYGIRNNTLRLCVHCYSRIWRKVNHSCRNDQQYARPDQKFQQGGDFHAGAGAKCRAGTRAVEEETDDNIYIKVYFHREGVVKEMALDEYIMGVLYGEVPETYHPEALKAQAVAARSYTLYRIQNQISHDNGADICTDYTHCQAWTQAEGEGSYPASIVSAVEETHNMIATYDGQCINALYFSNSGGYTESVENVWGGAPYPYLVSVEAREKPEITIIAA